MQDLMRSEYDPRPTVERCEQHPSGHRDFEVSTVCLGDSRLKFAKNAPQEFVRAVLLCLVGAS